MDFENKYPYTDFHELNLDWILKQMKALAAAWDAYQEQLTGTNGEWPTFKNYIETAWATYKENLTGTNGEWPTFKATMEQAWNDYQENLTGTNGEWPTFKATMESEWQQFFDNYLQTLGVVQITGQSVTDVMSQKAVSDLITKNVTIPYSTRAGYMYYTTQQTYSQVSNGNVYSIAVNHNIQDYYVSTGVIAQTAGFALINYLDQSNTFISYEVINIGSTDTHVENYKLTIPDNAAIILINWRNSVTAFSIIGTILITSDLNDRLIDVEDAISGKEIELNWEYKQNVFTNTNTDEFIFNAVDSRSRVYISNVRIPITITPNQGFAVFAYSTTDNLHGTPLVNDFVTEPIVLEPGYSYWVKAKKTDDSDFIGDEDISVNKYSKILYEGDAYQEVKPYLDSLDQRVSDLEAAPIKKHLSILFVGNSLTQDGIAYLPYVLKNYYGDEIDFKFYMFYNGGYTLAQQYQDFVDDAACDIFSIAENSASWTNTSAKMSNILSTYKFDVVCMQEYFNYKASYDVSDLADWNNCRDYITANYTGGNGLEFISLFHAPLRSNLESVYQLTKDGNALILKDTISQDMIPIGMGVYNAMQTSLDSLGDAGHLSPDGTHTQEGLPCLLQTFVAACWVLDKLSINKSIYGCPLRMTTAIYNTINVPGPNIGSGVITGTDAQNILAQEVAIMSYKEGKKFVIDNLTANA